MFSSCGHCVLVYCWFCLCLCNKNIVEKKINEFTLQIKISHKKTFDKFIKYDLD